MIERCERLPQNLPQNVVTARINALYNTYCDSVGVDIFTQTDDHEVTAVFGGMDGSFSLLTTENADFEELNSYFSFLGATVFCFEKTANRLGCQNKTVSGLYELKTEVGILETDGHGSISDVYKALQKGGDGDISLPPFDYWYTDFCLRFNHGAAEYSLSEASVAVCGFMTDSVSLITGVATAENRRGKGDGSRVLRNLISNIMKKHPTSRVFAATNSAAGFYIKNGFARVGTVAVCEF